MCPTLSLTSCNRTLSYRGARSNAVWTFLCRLSRFNSCVVLGPIVRTKIKRKIMEGVRLIVTCGAVVEESRRGPKIMSGAKDVGADKWMVPGAYVCACTPSVITRGFCIRVSCRLDLLCSPHNRDVPYAFHGTH
jgi:hypothetical protein